MNYSIINKLLSLRNQIELNEQFEAEGDFDMTNRIIFIPSLNPDGNSRHKRVNSNNIDINRNFPTTRWQSNYGKHRKTSGSEIETQFLLSSIANYNPDLVISIHAPYNYIDCSTGAEDEALAIAELTNMKIPKEGLNDKKNTPRGSFGEYCEENEISMVTVEFPKGLSSEELIEKINPMFEYLESYNGMP